VGFRHGATESAAVSLKAATEALLKCMPASDDHAATADALFRAAVIPSRTTGNHALEDLLAVGAIQRLGTGARGNPFRYFKRFPASEDRAARIGESALKKLGKQFAG
jgi:phosphosulfolactate phosphohydrolase-like enzyme